MFVSTHYTGKEAGMKFEEGEAWKKVFGPVLVYLNSVPTVTGTPGSLWEDAKRQVLYYIYIYIFPFIKKEH